jgi:hypothetical protein
MLQKLFTRNARSRSRTPRAVSLRAIFRIRISVCLIDIVEHHYVRSLRRVSARGGANVD